MNAIPGIAEGALPPGVAEWLAQAVASSVAQKLLEADMAALARKRGLN